MSDKSSDEGRVVLAESVDKDGENKGMLNALFRLAWPSIFAGWLKSSFSIADVYAGGKLGSSALTALAVSVLFAWLLNSLSKTNAFGALSLISRAIGEGDDKKAASLFGQGLKYALVFGLSASLMLGVFAYLSITNMGLSEAVLSDSASYLTTILGFGVFIFVSDTLEQSFRASGDAKTPLKVFGVFALVNLALNPLLSLGPGAMWPWSDAPASGLGTQGIALATVMSYAGIVCVLFVLAKKRGLILSSGAHTSPWKFWKIGLPQAIAGAAFDLIWVIITPMIVDTDGGEQALAAITVAHRFESVSYLTSLGLASACGALVGQAMGLGRPRLARKVALRASLWGAAFGALVVSVLIAFSEEAMGLFTDDERIVAFGHDYFVLVSFSIALQAVEAILLGAFSGTGKTALPSAISLLCHSSRIPLVFFMVSSQGVNAVFYAIAISSSLCGLLLGVAFYFRGARAER